MNSPKSDLDGTDLAILRLMQEDGRLSAARLSERLALSETPVWRRLKRLEAEGYIESYQANLDRRKLGYTLLAFVHVNFAVHTDEAPAQFEAAVQAIPEVLSCHNISGESDYYLQVVARDLESYGEFVANVLRKLPGVTAIHSSFSMREIKASSRFPVG